MSPPLPSAADGTPLLFMMSSQLCSTPAWSPVHPNSTFAQIVSPCLARVLIPAVPFLLSLFSFCALCLHPLLFPNDGQRLPLAKLALAKLLLSSLDLLLSIADLCLTLALPAAYLGPSPVLPEQSNSATFSFSFSICSLLAYGQCFRCGFITSGSLHLAWFARLLSLLPSLLLAIPAMAVPANLALLLRFCFALALTISLCVADSANVGDQGQYQRLDTASRHLQGKEESPENHASAISSVTYWYASKMVWLGLRGTITFDQLWALDKGNRAEFLRDRFYRTAKSRRQDEGGTVRPISLGSFLWRLFLCVWEWNLSATIMAIFIVLGRYANASFLRIIVSSVNAQNPLWLSIAALFGLFFVDLASKVLTARRDFHSFRCYLNIRSVLTAAIFDKMLRLSSAGRSKYSAGEVINLLTTDVMRIRLLFWQLRDFIYCPFMVLIAFFGLFMEIGWNTLYGVVILFSVLPFNYALSKLNTKYEQEQMKIKDARLKLVNDVLSGMKVLKLYAWEESMQKQIFDLRKREMNTLRKIFLLDVVITVSFQLAPLIATLVSFFGYTILQANPMRPEVAFVTLLFFAMLRYSIYQIPQLLMNAIKAWVSGKRVLALLNEQEQQPSHILRQLPGQNSLPIVLLRHCSFSWNSVQLESPTLHLRDISLDVAQGQLIGIVGKVGAGKSSLLAAILGEMERVQQDGGEAMVQARTIGYVPQQPWIQNRTLRGNVLFDSPMDEGKYGKVLGACALEDDLKLLAAGDLTEIGEKGINLSGGQKARVALARAVYMDADMYVLDDTLSAVDAHVGAHIFDRVIGEKGLLAKKTRLWALNSLSFLRHCDRIVVMDGGGIHAIGTLDELKQQKEGPFAELIREFMEKHLERQRSAKSGTIEVEEEDTELAEVLNHLSGSPLSQSLLEHRRMLEQHPAGAAAAAPIPPLSGSLPSNGTTAVAQMSPVERQLSTMARRLRFPSQSSEHSLSTTTSPSEYNRQQQVQIDSELVGKLTEEEELAIGMVSRRVYLDYIRAFGVWLSLGFFLSTILGSSVFEALSSVWLAKWSSADVNSTAESAWNLAIYGGFNAVYVICTSIGGILIAIGAYHASTTFHDQLVRSLFRSPMAFFDRTPLGRILNRLSNDIDRIDENIPWAISIAMSVFSEALNSLISICVVIPLLTLVVLPLLAIFLFIVHFYNLASVQLRRLTSKSWSSTCSFVQDAHLGADSIRVFNVRERFREKCCQLADLINESFSVEIYTNRWLQIRLDLISDLAVFICVLVAILMASQGIISLGALAMVIGCGYTFTGYLGDIARVWRESEVQMVCIERVGEYIGNEHEPEWRLASRKDVAPADWPSAGHIHFRDLCLRYRPGMDLVLTGLNFEVKPGEKVGIVGRTGAGKSSLTLALFRIVEPSSGQILIDGVDICSLGLHDLREALTIIPQDPVLFCGTLRTNLDPFEEYPDERLWEALEKAHLKETVRQMEGELAYEVAESGSNLSVGQRQLVCLARAILRHKTRILVLDEATAAIDADTDARIQQSIRGHFKHCTLLTIAHRLNTILDYDRILVMDAGKVAEFDAPAVLLANPQSQFFQLAKQAGVGLASSRREDEQP